MPHFFSTVDVEINGCDTSLRQESLNEMALGASCCSFQGVVSLNLENTLNKNVVSDTPRPNIFLSRSRSLSLSFSLYVSLSPLQFFSLAPVHSLTPAHSLSYSSSVLRCFFLTPLSPSLSLSFCVDNPLSLRSCSIRHLPNL